MFSINGNVTDALSIILKSIVDSTIEKKRLAALVMFEIVVNNIEDNGDNGDESHSRLLRTLYNKAVQGFSNGRDSRFEEYVHKFEELLKKNEGENTKKLETRAHVVELVDKLKDRCKGCSYNVTSYVEQLKSRVPSLAMKKAKRLERELNRLA
jgi:hypothetical protein